jgi:hypothetical protein
MAAVEPCSCRKVMVVRGTLCATCGRHRRSQKGWDALPPVKSRPPKCKYRLCDRPARLGRLCAEHDRVMRELGESYR